MRVCVCVLIVIHNGPISVAQFPPFPKRRDVNTEAEEEREKKKLQVEERRREKVKEGQRETEKGGLFVEKQTTERGNAS